MAGTAEMAGAARTDLALGVGLVRSALTWSEKAHKLCLQLRLTVSRDEGRRLLIHHGELSGGAREARRGGADGRRASRRRRGHSGRGLAIGKLVLQPAHSLIVEDLTVRTHLWEDGSGTLLDLPATVDVLIGRFARRLAHDLCRLDEPTQEFLKARAGRWRCFHVARVNAPCRRVSGRGDRGVQRWQRREERRRRHWR